MKRQPGRVRWVAMLPAFSVFALLGIFAAPVAAQEFEAGRHYDVLPVPVETAGGDAVEVVEVFSYACVHCYNFDPLVAAWERRQPADVRFERLPAPINPVWEQLARVYYAAEALGVTDALHMPMFEAIHVHRVDVRDEQLVARIFGRYADVGQEAFQSAYESFGVDTRVRQAAAMSRAYRITAVPTLIVAGKYRIEANLAGSLERMLDVVDFLVAKERSEANLESAPQA